MTLFAILLALARMEAPLLIRICFHCIPHYFGHPHRGNLYPAQVKVYGFKTV